jgi:hypothetical protein
MERDGQLRGDIAAPAARPCSRRRRPSPMPTAPGKRTTVSALLTTTTASLEQPTPSPSIRKMTWTMPVARVGFEKEGS